jgi:hypothetical protein
MASRCHRRLVWILLLSFMLTVNSFRARNTIRSKVACCLIHASREKSAFDNLQVDGNSDPVLQHQHPQSTSDASRSSLTQLLKPLALSALYLTSISTRIRPAVASDVEYQKLGFTLSIPDGWTILPRKLPSVTLSQYMSEEILLVASNFVEGVSLSVTKSDARRLLKDFNIDWWFGSISAIEDVGNADLISKLLILQRQGNFDGKSPSAASLLSSSLDNQILSFAFDMPVAEGVARKTLTKSFFKNGYLYSLWISGLDSIFDGDYAAVVRDIQNSFTDSTS